MSFLKKIKESLRDPAAPKGTMNRPVARPIKPKKKVVNHEYIDFSKAYRIGILSLFSELNQDQKIILDYKKKLERLGFECEVLLFSNQREKNPKVYLPSFNLSELDKEQMPNSPRTDRFMVRRFDILLNLYFEPCTQLLHLSTESNAKCRVSPYIDFLTPCSDVLIPMEQTNNVAHVIEKINDTLNLQPYVRPEI